MQIREAKMKNFFNLVTGVNVLPLMLELQRKPELWDQHTIRTKTPGTPHGEVSDILLMFNQYQDVSQSELFGKVVDDKDVVPYPAWKELPAARPLIFGLLNQVSAIRLGRVIITKLPPGKVIPAHVDGGAPATYYTRYQIALHCLPGNQFVIEDEVVEFNTGDVWMIDNTKEHAVINNSPEDRIVMIVDARSE